MGKHVYVDESGDESVQLELPSISSFYIVCALVVDPSNLATVQKRFEEVRARYFKNREMKSTGIGNPPLRQHILQELAGGDFALHLLIGNKKLLTSPGLRYPKSFIKYLHRFLYKEITKDHPAVHILADKIKNPAFMKEMRSYLDRNNVGGLFEMISFDFVDSKSDVCVQAADFIAGSVRACFERNPQTALTDPSMEKLRCRIVQLLPFPESYGRYIAKIPELNEYDADIEARAVLEAEDFLRAHENAEDSETVLQVEVVRALLLALSWRDDCWVSTQALMSRLNVLVSEELTEQAFRGVIGSLRDAGLLIASRTAGGYKLPTSMADITEFLNRQNSQLAPMIERVRIARDTVARATGNAVDILGAPEFQNLKAAVSASLPWYAPVEETHDLVAEPAGARRVTVPDFAFEGSPTFPASA
jgi:hypothetical protein